ELDPLQVGLQVGDLVVAGEPVDRVAIVPGVGELAHPVQEHLPVRVQHGGGGPSGHKREHHPGEQIACSGYDRVHGRKPGVQLRDSLRGDRVQLAVRTRAGLHAHSGGHPVPFQALQGGVHLAVLELAAVTEQRVVAALEVEAVGRSVIEQGEQRHRYTHTGHYTLSVYTGCLHQDLRPATHRAEVRRAHRDAADLSP